MKCSICNQASAKFACSACEHSVYCSILCAQLDRIETHLHAEHVADLIEMPKNIISAWGDVYIGSVAALNDKYVMSNIQAVLSVLHTSKSGKDGVISTKYLHRLVKQWPNVAAHLHVSIYDEPKAPIERYFEQMAQFIHAHIQQGHNVLVHCHAGMSRSVTAVLYYMMKYRGYNSVEEALETVKKSRPIAHPNKGFIKKLTISQEMVKKK